MLNQKVLSNVLKIIYICNNQENVVDFDTNDTLLLFKLLISNKSQINLEDYDIYYEGLVLTDNYEKMKLKDIIQNNKFPIFYIKIKDKIDESLSIKPKGVKEKYKNIVQLESFPSRPEIFSFFENFIANNKIKDGYYYWTEASNIKFSFKHLDTAYSFMKIMMDKKYNNHLYEKIKVYLFIDENKKSSINKFETGNNIDSILKDQSSILNYDFKYLESKFHSVKPKKTKAKKVLNNNFISIQNSSPYITNEERERKEYQENRKKWLGNDFSGCVNSNRYPRFIKNYVNISPSLSPLRYEFREVKKSKWVGEIDFII